MDQDTSLEQPSAPLVQKWAYEIDQYERRMSDWEKRGKKIAKRYLDERDGLTDQRAARFASLWASVQTLLPAMYSQLPKPEIERRFRDHDDVGRMASEVLQRCVAFSLAAGDAHTTFRQLVLDYLLVARAVPWIRYVPYLRAAQTAEAAEDSADGTGEVTDDQADELQEVEWEEVVADYVHWQDFGHGVGRTWQEVTAVWRRVFLTRKELVERFGEEIGNEVPLTWKEPGDKTSGGTTEGGAPKVRKAVVYEVWDRVEKHAVWICKDYHRELDVRDDPLKLRAFFPCPKPLFGTLTNDKLEPTPDYTLYQDQALQLDELTSRVSMITKSLKVAGVYDASAQGVQRLLNEGVENTLIPVDSWAVFGEKGGLQGAIQFLPLQEIAAALNELYDAREKVKADLYEITGISDLLRGQSDAEETATAQGIKAGYATLRFQDRRNEVARFLRDTIQLMVEVIARHFSVQTLETMSGLQLFPDPATKDQVRQLTQPRPNPMQQGQMIPPQIPMTEDLQEKLDNPTWAEVMDLVHNDGLRTFRIDIETDSTVRADEAQEKADRTEFLQAVSAFMDKALPAAQATPQLAPLMGQMLLFAVRAFRVGRQLEGDFEAAIDQMRKLAQNPPPHPPNPEMVKIQGDMQLQQQKMQAEGQARQQELQAQIQLETVKAQKEIEIQRQRAQMDMQLEQWKHQQQAAADQRQQAVEAQRDQLQARQEASLEQMRMGMQAQLQSMQQSVDVLLARIAAASRVEVAEVAAQAQLQAAQTTAANQAADSTQE